MILHRRNKLLCSAVLTMGLLLSTPVGSMELFPNKVSQGHEIDFTNKETLKKSLGPLLVDFSHSESLLFDYALFTIMFNRHPAFKNLPMYAANKKFEALGDKFFQTFEGKLKGITFEQVLAQMVKPETALLEKQFRRRYDKERLAEAIAIADKKKLERAAMLKLFCIRAKVLIKNAQFPEPNNPYNVKGAKISMVITNNLTFAISAIRFNYVVKGDERAVPVAQGEHTLTIAGGIEPNETSTGSAPTFKDLSKYKVLVIKTTLLNVWDSENRELINNNSECVYNK